MRRYLFTSESVSEGHPDKMADQISDAILDAYLVEDPHSKVACETLLTKNQVVVAGETHSSVLLTEQIPDIIRRVIREVGYTSDNGYDPDDLKITNLIHEQSLEIRKGVDRGGAGDQGLMFGYACKETPSLMPYAIWLAHQIMETLSRLRKTDEYPWIFPDAKSQVTVVYENGFIKGIDNIVVSVQHAPYMIFERDTWSAGAGPPGHYNGLRVISSKNIRETMISQVITPLVSSGFDPGTIKYLINPAGSFTQGGPAADTGLTGRKIMVDTYGGSCPHGGGAFSGKDPTKVDRSGAYMARYLAKNIVASGIAEKCLVQLAYAIGYPEPVSILLDFMGTGKEPESIVEKIIRKTVNLTPQGIIERFDLLRPIYQRTATYGHFGKENEVFKWENTDLHFD